MITEEIVYTETRVWKLDHAWGVAKGNSHMGKGVEGGLQQCTLDKLKEIKTTQKTTEAVWLQFCTNVAWAKAIQNS